MARSRVNVKFILAVAAAVGAATAAAGTAYVANRYYSHRHHETAVEYAKRGDAYMAVGDVRSAAREYQFAVQTPPVTAENHWKLGRALMRIPDADGKGALAATAEYQKAVDLQPNYKPAWAELFATHLQELSLLEAYGGQMSPEKRAFFVKRIGSAPIDAAEMLKLGPDDADARSALPVLYVRMAILGLPLPAPAGGPAAAVGTDGKPLTDVQRTDRAVSDLTQVVHDHPEYAEASLWVARYKLFQVRTAYAQDHTVDVHPACFEAVGVFDAPIAARPDEADLYIAKEKVIIEAGQIDQSPADQKDLYVRMHDALEKAQTLVDPKADPDKYLASKLQWAIFLYRVQRDPGRAEPIFADLIQRFPERPSIRLDLADMISQDASRKADALEVLGKIGSQPPVGSTDVQRAEWLRVVPLARLLRARIQTDHMQETSDPTERQQMADDVKVALADAAKSLPPDRLELLKARGRFQLVSGDIGEAIKTLTAAHQVMDRTNVVDPDLLYFEAQAYQRANQPGKAIDLIEAAIRNPEFAKSTEVHMTLAQLYVGDRQWDGAHRAIAWLTERMPDDPRVIRLEIAALGPTYDATEARALFDRLPEKAPAERAQKEQIAKALKLRDEGVRLTRLQLESKPNDPDLAIDLAYQLMSMGEHQAAAGVVAMARAAHPDDTRLRAVEDMVAGTSTSAAIDLGIKDLENEKDPLKRALGLAALARAQGKSADELTHMLEAAKLQPETRPYQLRVFDLYLQTGQTDKATDMVPHLTAMNADEVQGASFKLNIALAKGDVRTAVELGRQLVTDNPERADVFAMYGNALRASGQLAGAVQQFATCLKKQPNNIVTLTALIQCSEQLGQVADARRYLADARQRYPEIAGYRAMEIAFESAHGQPDAALPLVDDALRQFPKDRQVCVVGDDAFAAAAGRRYLRGDQAGGKDLLVKEQAQLRLDVTTFPDDLDFAERLATACAKLEDLPAAEAALVAIGDRPQWKGRPEPKVVLGRLYLMVNKSVEAEAPLRQALLIDPKSDATRLLLADDLAARGAKDKAMEILQPACDDFAVRSRYTDLQLQTGKIADADADLTAALAAHPGDAQLSQLLAVVLNAEGKRDEAMKLVTSLIAADPTNVKARMIRGRLLLAATPPDAVAASAEFRRAVDAQPNDVEARYDLSAALAAIGDRDGMLRELEALVRLVPDRIDVRLKLAQGYLQTEPPRLADAEQTVIEGLSRAGSQHDVSLQLQAAVIYAREDQKRDKSLAALTDAMDHAKESDAASHTQQAEDAIRPSYLQVLSMDREDAKLIAESEKIAADPKSTWTLHALRGQSKARLNDMAGAKAEFNVAFDKAGALPAPGAFAACSAASAMAATAFGDQPTIDLIAPRAKGGRLWKLALASADVAAHRYGDALPILDDARTPTPVDPPTPAELAVNDKLAALAYAAVSPPQPAKAADAYRRLLAVAPDDIDSLNNLAALLTDPPNPSQADVAEALVDARKACGLIQKVGRVPARMVDTLGWALILDKQVDEGMETLRNAADLADFPDVRYHMAMGYLSLKHPEDAARELQRAQELMDNAPKTSPAVEGRPNDIDPAVGGRIKTAQNRADLMKKEQAAGR